MSKVNLPPNLTKEARAYINTVISNLKKCDKLDSVDAGALYMLADSYDNYIIASKTIKEEGQTTTSVQGNVIVHPCVKIMKDNQKICLEIMQDFGLTLKSRSKLNVIEGAEEPDSALDAFIKETLKK